jgi:hypothetical protein
VFAEDAPRALRAVTGGFEHAVAQSEPYPTGRLVQDQGFGEGRIAPQRMNISPQGEPGPFLAHLDFEALGDGRQECGMRVIAAGHYFLRVKGKARAILSRRIDQDKVSPGDPGDESATRAGFLNFG